METERINSAIPFQIDLENKKPPKRDMNSLEASYWHLPVIAFHLALPKVRG